MNKVLVGSLATIALTLVRGADASDLAVITPAPKPPALVAYDWTGIYVGTHVGYATGSSGWSATQLGPAAPSLTGTLDLFSRAGGLLGGFEVGYAYMLPSPLVLGLEADVSFPNYLNSTEIVVSPLIGQASYAEAVEFSGTVRGRIGYALNNWLIY